MAPQGEQLDVLPAQNNLRESESFLLVGLTAAEQADLTVLSCGGQEAKCLEGCSASPVLATFQSALPLDLSP